MRSIIVIISLFYLQGCEYLKKEENNAPIPPDWILIDLSFDELPSLNKPQLLNFHFTITGEDGEYPWVSHGYDPAEYVRIQFSYNKNNLEGMNAIADSVFFYHVKIGDTFTLSPEFQEKDDWTWSFITVLWFFGYESDSTSGGLPGGKMFMFNNQSGAWTFN